MCIVPEWGDRHFLYLSDGVYIKQLQQTVSYSCPVFLHQLEHSLSRYLPMGRNIQLDKKLGSIDQALVSVQLLNGLH